MSHNVRPRRTRSVVDAEDHHTRAAAVRQKDVHLDRHSEDLAAHRQREAQRPPKYPPPADNLPKDLLRKRARRAVPIVERVFVPRQVLPRPWGQHAAAGHVGVVCRDPKPLRQRPFRVQDRCQPARSQRRAIVAGSCRHCREELYLEVRPDCRLHVNREKTLAGPVRHRVRHVGHAQALNAQREAVDGRNTPAEWVALPLEKSALCVANSASVDGNLMLRKKGAPSKAASTYKKRTRNKIKQTGLELGSARCQKRKTKDNHRKRTTEKQPNT